MLVSPAECVCAYEKTNNVASRRVVSQSAENLIYIRAHIMVIYKEFNDTRWTSKRAQSEETGLRAARIQWWWSGHWSVTA